MEALGVLVAEAFAVAAEEVVVDLGT